MSVIGKIAIATKLVGKAKKPTPYVLDMVTGREIRTDGRVITALERTAKRAAKLEVEIAELAARNKGLQDELYGLRCEVERLDRENRRLRELGMEVDNGNK